MNSQIKKLVCFFMHANVVGTLVFNFRMLPLKQAVRLPIHLFGKVDYSECLGGAKYSYLRIIHILEHGKLAR